MMLSCKEAARLASQELDRPLRPGERLALRFHLALCRGCNNFRKQVLFLRKAMQRLGERD